MRVREAPGVRRLFDTAMVQSLLGKTEVKDPDRAWTARGRAQTRRTWRKALPGPNLTWGKELTGEAFVSKVEAYASFGEETIVLEVGPGYGRLLRSFLAPGIPFKDYYAPDISERNIEYLSKQFPRPDIHFMWADIEEVSLPFRLDVGFSSLTLSIYILPLKLPFATARGI
jgi:SAM-dependent methyltransferase